MVRGLARALMAFLAATAAVGAGVVPAAAAVEPGRPGTERVIVQLRARADVAPLAQEQRERGGTVRHVYRHVLDGFAADLPTPAVEALRRNPRVLAVSPDTEVHLTQTQPSPPWGLDRIDQRPAALDGGYGYDTTGTGTTVYVVDSGVRLTHTEFGGRARSGWDFVDDDADASDCHGHGTHVAGTVAARTYGVAKEAQVVSLRVFSCQGSGWASDVVAAFDWVAGDAAGGPAVVNFSGGGPADSATDAAVDRLTAAGIPTVVAAANDGADACLRSPARAASAITVGATGVGDARASYSNFGACVDLFAPGTSVLSSTATSDGATGTMSGTSMATPHVAGAVARHLQLHPSASVAEVAAALQQQATRGVVADSRSTNDGLLFVAPPAVPVISESFGSSVGGLVRVSGGTWGVSSGRYVLSAPADSSAANANLSVHGTAVSGDFVLSVSGTATATASAWNDFSVVFGYQDPANYLYASFNESNDANTNGLFRVAGGVRSQLADFSVVSAAGSMHAVRVERVGSTVRVLRSGTLLAEVVEAGFVSGKVGFGTDNDGATFDDLLVTR